jgi:probable HAF family extracellular repeat protein
VRWSRASSTPTDLGSLAGLTPNVAGSINNRGEVTGTSPATDGTLHSFLWRKNTGMKDIGTLPGAILTVTPCCHSLNNNDEITGFWIDGDGNLSAFYWKDNVITDLNALISANSGWYLLNTASINDAGQIAGFGVNPQGEIHAFLATPCSGSCPNEADAFVGEYSTRKLPMPLVPESVRRFISQQLKGSGPGGRPLGDQ